MTKKKAKCICGCLMICVSVAILVGLIWCYVSEQEQNIVNQDIVNVILNERTPIDETERLTDGYIPYRVTVTNQSVDGVLSIEKIDLLLPIFSEVTDANMKQSVCRVTGTNAPGCKNYCILGHNRQRYGALFNRLDELVEGDIITVTANGCQYEYKVSEIHITKGVDYSFFEDFPNEQRITLLTCDYSIRNGRRVVVGQLVKISE